MLIPPYKLKRSNIRALVSLGYEEYFAVAFGKTVEILKNVKGENHLTFKGHDRDLEQISPCGDMIASASLTEIILWNWRNSNKYRRINTDSKSIRSIVLEEIEGSEKLRILIGGSEVKVYSDIKINSNDRIIKKIQ